jgi:hypothetical protein
MDPIVLEQTRRDLLARCVQQDALLVGPIFAAPGAGQVTADGGTWRLDGATVQ